MIGNIKTRALNTGLFRQLCDEKNEIFKILLLHTEVRWLSKGLCLKRFFSLYDTILKCLLSNHQDDLAKDIDYIRGAVAYLSDVFEKMNQLILKLQGPNFNLVKARAAVLTFVKKLEVFKQNRGRRECSQPPSLLLTFRLAKKRL